MDIFNYCWISGLFIRGETSNVDKESGNRSFVTFPDEQRLKRPFSNVANGTNQLKI
ncbi:hypothetical protein KM914_07520 [Virgibacillus pantothenticus]|uniref:hypothetical protein n=1 Tax=Virgibacillus pantothenticus TaxID=1473 RepID=UPI000AB9F6B4|nr:hypothetical protein [Virgibacillus pantothenticus]MBS7430163.1 hypothetical protein [Virgibacillus sp. 19R1-5]MBU8566279.1 hypothetical protein [Virgibacillus pantothenticus]MBU8640809.1 hypothetical protein [Virgibacillus pantothenticus]MBU8646436.1 hypothetical protein [Virgibacillus pantothenticus]MBU8660160.1 hypothetical protein [Virgibacillus pantothenticus]